MELLQNPKGYSGKYEEVEEDEEEEEMGNFACNFTPPHQIQWLEGSSRSSLTHQPLTPTEAIDFHGKLQLTDLSLRIDSGGGSFSGGGFVEREHMFDKVVTPSDVGKLNRLVIPKQFAEKFFPLDSSTHEKGLILNFEDRNGKQWRFRYSYWNSSQSYVMTKGWSRFVKEKKLDAGDIVSFGRGVGDPGKDRLFIDWRRRVGFTNHHQVPNPLLLLPQSARWGGRHAHPLHPAPPLLRCHQHQHLHHMNHSSNLYPNYSPGSTGTSNSLYYLRPTMCSYKIGTMQQSVGEIQASSMAVNSAPMFYNGKKTCSGAGAGASTATAPKRLRLFGVNMECAATEQEDPSNDGVTIETDQLSRRGKKPSNLNWETP